MDIFKHWRLIWEVTRRELSERYVGQVFGVIWAVGHPLIIMAVYLFVFTVVFKQKVAAAGVGHTPMNFNVYIICGLIPWMTVQEVLTNGCGAITWNTSLVKQIVFPIEILPVKYVLAAFFSQLITTAILIGYMLIVYHSLPLMTVMIPVLWGIQIIAMLGAAYLLSAVGVFFRDIKDIVQVLSFVGMYLMPMFYLIEWMPAVLRPIAYCNPLSYMLWCYHDVFYYGSFVHWYAWIVFPVGALLSLWFGRWVFEKTKHMFGDVL